MRYAALSLLIAAFPLPGAERRADPTFIRRSLATAPNRPGEYAATGVGFKLMAGLGDPDTHVMRGLARFGELTVDPGSSTALVIFPNEEQAIMVIEGKAVLRYPDGEHGVRRGDFFYIPPSTRYAVSNTSSEPSRMIVMGFRVRGEGAPAVPRLLIDNLDDVKKQVVGNHPPSTLYQLMIGDRKSTRDAISAGRVLTSLYVMEFAPGGTNLPHHHETEEEAYLVLDGEGQMVAGSGTDGIEGRYPVRAGDAYFFRLNCTVGFYNAPKGGKARILAVRWLFPFARRQE